MTSNKEKLNINQQTGKTWSLKLGTKLKKKQEIKKKKIKKEKRMRLTCVFFLLCFSEAIRAMRVDSWPSD